MNKLTAPEAKILLSKTFLQEPLPPIPADADLFHDTIYDFRGFKNKLWSELTFQDIEESWGFCSGKYHVDDKYYLYYLPGLLLATFDVPDSYPLALHALLPHSNNFRINTQWKELIEKLNDGQMNTLIEFFTKCKTDFVHAKIMETDILIDLLRGSIVERMGRQIK